MKTILKFFGNIFGIIELPIINLKQRNGYEKWSLFIAPIKLLLGLIFLPFKFLWTIGFGYYDKCLAIIRAMFWISSLSWVAHIAAPIFVPDFCTKIYNLPLPKLVGLRNALTAAPTYLYEKAHTLMSVQGYTGNALFDSGIGFIMFGIVSLIMLIIAVYTGFIFYGVAQTSLMTIIWTICAVIAIIQTIGQVKQYGESWLKCCYREFANKQIKEKMWYKFLDWMQWMVYFIPVINVIAYRIWMAHDRKYGYYKTKPLLRKWTSDDFFGARNSVHSTFVV